jgi:hypothetical protein
MKPRARPGSTVQVQVREQLQSRFIVLTSIQVYPCTIAIIKHKQKDRNLPCPNGSPFTFSDGFVCYASSVQITLRNAGPDPIAGVAVLLELSNALSLASTNSGSTPDSGSTPVTINVPNTIPVKGSLQVIVTLKVAESAKPRDLLTVLTTAQYFTIPTRTKKNTIRVAAK